MVGLTTHERRMVTVLFADLVDSTALTGRLDAERVREVLGAFYDAASHEILALRGQPEKFIGDAVMAVFGLPQAHEDDAIRAVRAGLAICARVPRLAGSITPAMSPVAVRVGIQSGDVAAGVGPAGQLLVTGQAVNAAARLQAAAEPGEVLVGDTTNALVQMSATFGEERKVRAKGFDEPLTAYPVRSLTTRSIRRTIPLVGRQPELALVRSTLARVAASGRPHLFTLLGEPGVGKSRLVEELVAGIGDDARAIVGRIQPPDWGTTFSPLVEMLQDIAEIDEDDLPERAKEALERVVEGCCDPIDTQRVSAQLALTLGDGGANREEPAFVQEVQSGFTALVDGMTGRGPVVVVFDGIERAGPALLDLIERLPARARRASRPLLVVATGRPEVLESRPAWGTGADDHTTMRLQPLGPGESEELARQAGSGQVGVETAGRVAARAGGNPFFIVEMTGMLLRGEDGQPARRGAALPPTVQAVVAARLDHLPKDQRELVRRISVFVFSFDTNELRLLSDATEEELAALEDAEVLVRDERSRPRWRFRHGTLREVAYSSLTKRERLRLHLQVADGLIAQGRRPAWAADHLERAAQASLDLDPTDRALADRAADALAEAADRARRRMESAAAADLYDRSLAMSGPEDGWGDREARVLAGLGEARYWMGTYEAARTVLVRAEELAERVADDWALSVALRFRGDIVLNRDGDLEGAEALFGRALAAAQRSGDARAITRTLLFGGWVPWTREDYVTAEAVWGEALDLARANGDRWAEIRALTSISVSSSGRDDFKQSGRLAREAMDLAMELGDQFSVAVASVQLGRSLQDDDRGEEALACFDRALAVFDHIGARWEYADALRTRGVALRDLGRLDEAESDLLASLRISEGLGERLLTRWTWHALARVAEHRGDRATAEERLRRAEELPAPAPE
ncbi:MAG: ATP-binding protein [Acidimicrobiales bacterium]